MGKRMIVHLATAILVSMVVLHSCELIDIHPYDGKIEGSKHLNSSNIAKIERTLAKRDTIRFAVISDTQRWYDETEDEVASINKREGIDFVIHCGDLTDFGVTYNPQNQISSKSKTKRFKFPIFQKTKWFFRNIFS